MERKYRRIENIHELDEIKSKTLVEVPQRNSRFVRGVFIEKTANREILLFTRLVSDFNVVCETYLDADSAGNFPYDSIPQGTTFANSIKSWRGRKINRVLSRCGI